MNKKDLILFEEEIADLFNQGKIRAPVHLYKGNEDKVINVFKNIGQFNVIFSIIKNSGLSVKLFILLETISNKLWYTLTSIIKQKK